MLFEAAQHLSRERRQLYHGGATLDVDTITQNKGVEGHRIAHYQWLLPMAIQTTGSIFSHAIYKS